MQFLANLNDNSWQPYKAKFAHQNLFISVMRGKIEPICLDSFTPGKIILENCEFWTSLMYLNSDLVLS